MRENESFDILHDGVPRTSRDQKAMAYEAARFAKTQNPADIIEMVDRSNGTTSRRKDCWTPSPKKVPRDFLGTLRQRDSHVPLPQN
jgi:hypothetical protein